MSNSKSVIEAFCKGLNEDRKLFSQKNPNGKNFFVSTTCMPTFGCEACDRFGDTLGGVPHDGISTVFDQTFNRMNPVPRKCQKSEHNILLDLGFPKDISYIIQEYSKVFCDVSLYENTKIIYLVPGTETKKSIIVNNTEVQISHYDTVVEPSVDYTVINKFFNCRQPTVGTVEALRNNMRYWFDNNNNKFCELMVELRNNIKVSVATAFNDLYHIMKLPLLDFVDWIYQNMMRASSVYKLCSIQLSSNTSKYIGIVSAKFDPEQCGLNQEERKKARTYSNGEIVLKWELPGDLDLHVTGSKFHIFYSNKKRNGIALDHDNVSGGQGSVEIITFDPVTLLREGIKDITIHVLLFRRKSYNIPFEVTVKQNGFSRTEKGNWSFEYHGTGSDVRDSCFSMRIELKEPLNKIPIEFRDKLPDGFAFADETEFKYTKCENITMEAGRGISVFSLMHTRNGDFKNNITPIRVGGKKSSYQLSENVTIKDFCTINNVNYGFIGKKSLNDIPNVLMFTKEMFEFGKEGLEKAEKYRGKVYSPYKWWQADQILSLLGIPEVISRIVMSYTLDEDQLVSLFVIIKNKGLHDTGNWWNSYLQ